MLIGMLNIEGLWNSIFIGRLFLRGHLCFRCDVILTNRKIYRQLGSASQSKRKRGEWCMSNVWGRGSISKMWFTQQNAGRRRAFQHMQALSGAGGNTLNSRTQTRRTKRRRHAHNARPRFAACNLSSMSADPRLPHPVPAHSPRSSDLNAIARASGSQYQSSVQGPIPTTSETRTNQGCPKPNAVGPAASAFGGYHCANSTLTIRKEDFSFF